MTQAEKLENHNQQQPVKGQESLRYSIDSGDPPTAGLVLCALADQAKLAASKYNQRAARRALERACALETRPAGSAPG